LYIGFVGPFFDSAPTLIGQTRGVGGVRYPVAVARISA
jgi:hypothetical protein